MVHALVQKFVLRKGFKNEIPGKKFTLKSYFKISCKPLETLLKVLDPVCGSNAQTYGNLCILMQKTCTSKNNDLYVENPGVCEKPEPKNCGACAKTYGPVCGSGTILIFNNIFLINSLKIRKKILRTESDLIRLIPSCHFSKKIRTLSFLQNLVTE